MAIENHASIRLAHVAVGQQVMLVRNLKAKEAYGIGVFQGWYDSNGNAISKPEGTMKSWPVGTEAHYHVTANNGEDLGLFVLKVVAGMPGALFREVKTVVPATDTTPESTTVTYERFTAYASNADIAAMRAARIAAIEAKKAEAIKAEIEAHDAKQAKAKEKKAKAAKPVAEEVTPVVTEVTEAVTA